MFDAERNPAAAIAALALLAAIAVVTGAWLGALKATWSPPAHAGECVKIERCG